MDRCNDNVVSTGYFCKENIHLRLNLQRYDGGRSFVGRYTKTKHINPCQITIQSKVKTPKLSNQVPAV